MIAIIAQMGSIPKSFSRREKVAEGRMRGYGRVLILQHLLNPYIAGVWKKIFLETKKVWKKNGVVSVFTDRTAQWNHIDI